MVKVAFICEDDAGKKIIESQKFGELLSTFNIERIPNIINAKGKGNLTEENIAGTVNIALENGADSIFLLVDMDNDKCMTLTKASLIQHPKCRIIVCKHAVEAWFLADKAALSALLKKNIIINEPETPIIPFDTLNDLHKTAFKGRGVSKAILPAKLLRAGFSITNAAAHPNCPSARYFIAKIKSLTAQ
jgi:hypothetical protein